MGRAASSLPPHCTGTGIAAACSAAVASPPSICAPTRRSTRGFPGKGGKGGKGGAGFSIGVAVTKQSTKHAWRVASGDPGLPGISKISKISPGPTARPCAAGACRTLRTLSRTGRSSSPSGPAGPQGNAAFQRRRHCFNRGQSGSKEARRTRSEDRKAKHCLRREGTGTHKATAVSSPQRQ